MSHSSCRACAAILGALALLFALSGTVFAADLSPIEQLGKAIFFDANLSTPPGQSCATCHAPSVGFVGADSAINAAGAVYPGAIASRFGNRKPPTAAYGGDSPILSYDSGEGVWIGGMFWDGRATGWTLGDPLAEQAQGPFLNPLEQNMPGAKQVIDRVAKASYAHLFLEVWGPSSLSLKDGKKRNTVAMVYERIARSIAAYERSAEVNPFSSKYDAYLADETELTAPEAWGLELFEGKGKCNLCHISEPGMDGASPLFTDFTYDNLGVPKNPLNPFYAMVDWNPDGMDWVDVGLGGFLRSAGFPDEVWMAELGKFKVPTLRNVDLRPSPDVVKAYGHNGSFKSLEEITHFYNTRDVPGEGWNGMPWPEPEVPMNVNTDELGDLGLTADEEAAIVAFMKTLSDGWMSGAAAAH